jgi:hypothetical protein
MWLGKKGTKFKKLKAETPSNDVYNNDEADDTCSAQ